MSDGGGDQAPASAWSKLPKLARNLIIGLGLGLPLAAGGYWLVTRDHSEQVAHAKGENPAFTAENKRFLAEFRRLFPEAFKQAEAAGDGTDADPMRVVATFTQTNIVALTKAPDATLSEFARQRLVVLKQLKSESITACAQAVLSGNVDPKEASAKSRTASADLSLIMLRGMREGLDHPVNRGPRLPSDRAALTQALDTQGTPAPLKALVLRPSNLKTALPEQQCLAGITLYETILRLPPDVQGRTIATALGIGG